MIEPPVQDVLMSDVIVLDDGDNGVPDWGAQTVEQELETRVDPVESQTIGGNAQRDVYMDERKGHGERDLDYDELPSIQQSIARRNKCLKDAGAPIGSVSGAKQ